MTPGHIKKRWQGAYGRRMARWFGCRPFRLHSTRPLVSFTFDDFPRSALLVGADILEEVRAHATFYVAMGLESQTIETGEMFTLEDVHGVLDRGHELGCHTFHHCPAWETPTRDYISSVSSNSVALSALPQSVRPETHSFPISYPRPKTKRYLGTRFRGCRFGGQTYNRTLVDLNYLNSFFIEQSVGNFETIRRTIFANAENNGWLIFSTHDVTAHHTRFGCSPTFFQNVVEAVRQSGATILPMSGALDELRVPRLASIEVES